MERTQRQRPDLWAKYLERKNLKKQTNDKED
jgi:hypothetical protein